MNLTLIFVAGVSFLAGIILVSLAMFVGALLGRRADQLEDKRTRQRQLSVLHRLVPAVILSGGRCGWLRPDVRLARGEETMTTILLFALALVVVFLMAACAVGTGDGGDRIPSLLSRLLPALVNGVKLLVTGIAALVMAIIAAVSTIVGVVAKSWLRFWHRWRGLCVMRSPFLLSIVPLLTPGCAGTGDGCQHGCRPIPYRGTGTQATREA